MLNKLAQSNGTQDLDFDFPVVNVGSHPDNDIVLSGQGVLPFHATLHVQDGQVNLIALGGISAIKIDDAPLKASPARLGAEQRVEIGEFRLEFRQNGNLNGLHVRLTRLGAPPVVAGSAAAPLSYEGESPILVNVIAEQSEVEVGQTAFYELEIVNAGLIVAGFQVKAQGLPEAWVNVSPPMVNLYEGQRATVRITVTPPRGPESKAGTHKLTALVSSPNYGGQSVKTTLSLTIQPYYEFNIGGLSPRQQRIYWQRRSGVVTLPISNQGNSAADFNVTAYDDENGCSFDFEVSKGVERSRQATVSIPAGEAIKLPIEISPLKRQMVALRNRDYHYTATVQVAQQSALAQTVSGSVTSVPLIGWWTIVLTAILLLVGLFFLLQPNIYSYQVASAKDVIELGDTTRLEWSVSPFATRLGVSGVDQPITYGQTSLTVAPNQSTTYELVAGNWLSGLLGLDQRDVLTVLVVPPSPKINTFEVDSTRVDKGTPVTVRWSVTKATKAFLTIDQVVYELNPEKFSGEQVVMLEKDALVTLEAQSASGNELRSYYINVVPPKITVKSFTIWVRAEGTALVPNDSRPGGRLFAPARAAPDVNFPERYVELIPDQSSDSGYRVEFYQPDRELSKGEQVMLEWNVDGVEKVQIAPFTDLLPRKGLQPFFPQESMNFVMTAKSGELEGLYMLPVKVFDGTPPTAPKIEFFKASPLKMIGGGPVQFAWSVSGEWTKIQLATEGKVVADIYTTQGFKTINVTKSSTYILTAWNGALSSAAPVEIVVDPALKPVGLKIVSVYTQGNSTNLMVGGKASVTVGFFSDPANPNSAKPSPEPTGKVLVSDGVSTCEIALPAVTCELTFTTPGSPKEIKATYYGDAVYLQATSAANKDITVTSSKVKLSVDFYYLVKPSSIGTPIGDITNTPLNMNDGLYMIVTVQPVNTTLQDDKKGKISVKLCTQVSSSQLGTCDTTPIGVATVNIPSGEPNGIAEIAIQNFPAAGTRALKIEYSHEAYAIDTTSITQFDVHINKLNIFLSLPVCETPDTLTNCNIGSANSASSQVTFDLKNVADNSLLSVLLPPPSISSFAFSHFNGSTKITWGCGIVEKNATYKVECKNINFSTYGLQTVNFKFSNSNVYALIPSLGQFDLRVSKSTSLSINSTRLSGVKVGQVIVVTDNSNPADQLVRLMDASLTPPAQTTSATGKIIISDNNNTAGLFGVTSNSPGCSVAGNGSQLEINSRTARCEMFFNHVGTNLTLNFRYVGDNNNAGSTTSTQATIIKQTGITTRWQIKDPSTSVYTDWDKTSWAPNTLLPMRVILYDSTSAPLPVYAGESLLGRKVHIKIVLNSNPNNGSCVVTPASYVADLGNNEYEITVRQVGNNFVADLEAKCTQKQMDVAFNLTVAPGEQADLAFTTPPSAIVTRNLFFADRGSLSMSVSFVRAADNNESLAFNPDQIKRLFVGETYLVKVDVGTIWADYFLGIPGSPPSLTAAQDYYKNTPVKISLPSNFQDRVDTDNSTCGYNSTTNTVTVPLTEFSYKMEWGDSGQNGYSDIRVGNYSSPCTLVFLRGTSFGATLSPANFSYTAPSPIYGWGFEKTQTFAMLGLGKQDVTLSFGAPVITSGGNSSLSMFVSVPQAFSITLNPGVTGTTLSSLTASGLLELGKPATCTSMTGSQPVYAVPTATANANLTFPQACSGSLVVNYTGNDYFNSLTKNITVTVSNATTTTTTVTSSANPSRYGQSVTFTATLAPTNAPGTIQFQIDGVNVGGALTPNAQGRVTYAASAFELGVTGSPHEIRAIFTPSTTSYANSNGTLNQAVNQAVTRVVLSSNANPAYLGDSVTFTATVSVNSPGTGTPSGTVIFQDNGVDIVGSSANLPANGIVTYSPTNLTAGDHSITAVYSGDTNYATSTSDALTQPVKMKTLTAVSSNDVDNTTKYGEAVTFTASVSVLLPGTGTPTGKIQFKNGANNLGAQVDLVNGEASLTVDTLGAKNSAYSISAVYIPTANTNFGASTSTALAHTVQPSSTTTALAANPTSGVPTTTITLTATVTVDSPGAGTPVGTVKFYKGNINNNNNLLGTVDVVNGVASLDVTLAAGNYDLRAVFTSGSANFANSPTSALVPVVISPPPTPTPTPTPTPAPTPAPAFWNDGGKLAWFSKEIL